MLKPYIAIIGAGWWGKNLVRVFNELGVLKTICDLDEAILNERKEEYPILSIVNNLDELLKDEEIEAVVVATPAPTHYQIAKRILLAEKDVFVEKPLALKVKEGEELLEIVEKEKRILMVGHLLFYHPAIIELKKMIREGSLGEIRYIWSNRLNFGKLRREENVLWSFAPHDISVVIDILGMPKKVWAVGKSYLQKNIPDVTLNVLEFERNRTAHIFVSWLNPFKEQKLSVIGSRKMAVFDGVKNELIVFSHKITNKNSFLKAVSDKGEIIKFSQKEPLIKEANHFLECLKERRNPLTDAKEGLEVLKVLEACQKSLEENGKFQKI